VTRHTVFHNNRSQGWAAASNFLVGIRASSLAVHSFHPGLQKTAFSLGLRTCSHWHIPAFFSREFPQLTMINVLIPVLVDTGAYTFAP
jgi:hypothetical protein